MSLSRRAFAAGFAAIPLWQSNAQPQDDSRIGNVVAGDAIPVPQLFDQHELATVAAFAELIIPATDTPGAREAHVAEYLDLILFDSPDPLRVAFLEGLWWTDGYCQRSANAAFKDLSPADQLRVANTLYDSANENEVTGHLFVKAMKSWTAKIYYSTAIGQQELNKDERVPPTYHAAHC